MTSLQPKTVAGTIRRTGLIYKGISYTVHEAIINVVKYYPKKEKY